ncbi:MAG: dihydrolipoyl dehydrogenase [Actinomycetaceae bacterium]|nr:dihydrolipoyl dehydrogenase [Actinomycetaceae bacterium]
MSESEYDIVILGAGSAGYAAALRGAQLGMKIALIEADKVGGTCLHRGCIPTKALLHAAETADAVRESAKVGITATYQGIDMEALRKYRTGTVDRLHKGLQHLIKSRKIDLVKGWGKLVSQNTVEVDGKKYVGKNIILASGSYSKTLGLNISERVITSDQALELNWVPKSAIVLGGGVIGCEFASVWTSFGCEVTIIEGLPHLVANEDEAISKGLERQFRSRGIKYELSTMFDSVAESDSGVTVKTQDGKTFSADVLLVAIGRGPATANLGYEEVGIKMDRGFVLVDENLHTGVGNIYAAGDIVPGLQLAHRGFMQGKFLAELIAGEDTALMPDVNIPRVTFCEPEIASVGLTEKQAKEKFGEGAVTTSEMNLAGNGKSQMLGAAGLVKLVAQKDGPIVGFHALGARLGEQIGEGELMVNWEAYPEDVANLIHAHPTQNEAIGEAAMALAGKPLHG